MFFTRALCIDSDYSIFRLKWQSKPCDPGNPAGNGLIFNQVPLPTKVDLDLPHNCVYWGYLDGSRIAPGDNGKDMLMYHMGWERQMEDVANKIIEILKKNMKDPPETISLDTQLTDLEIESLDLAVIVFDIEDAFGIQIPYNANEEMTDFATVGSVVERVQALVNEKGGTAGAAA